MQLAHVLLNGDPLFRQVVVAVGTARNILKSHRDGGSLFQRLEKVLIPLHVPGQFLHAQRRQRFALGLAHIKNRHDFERRDLDFFLLGDGVPVLVLDRLALFVQLRHFLFHLIGGWGKYLDAFLALFDVAVKFIPPLVVARHKLPALHGNEDGVVKAVIVEAGHCVKVGLEAVAFKQIHDAGFQLVGNLFHAVGAVLAV